MIVVPVSVGLKMKDFKFALEKLDKKASMEVFAQQFCVFSRSYVSPLRCPLTKRGYIVDIYFHDSLAEGNPELAFLLSPRITILIPYQSLMTFCQAFQPKKVKEIGTQAEFASYFQYSSKKPKLPKGSSPLPSPNKGKSSPLPSPNKAKPSPSAKHKNKKLSKTALQSQNKLNNSSSSNSAD